MKVNVILHSYLREKLPPEAKGQTTLDAQEGATIRDIMDRLGLPDAAACAVNEVIERDRNRQVQDGDTVRFFRPGAGG